MQPKDPRQTNPIIPQRSYTRLNVEDVRKKTNDAAADIIRNQIDTIYEGQPVVTTAGQQDQEDENPYDRTHEANRTTLQADQWKHYHSAWQDYYQQYYQRYYLGEVYRMRQTLETPAPQSVASAASDSAQEEPMDTNEIFHDLRSDLLSNVRTSAVKVRGSRHFMPILAACLTMVLFLFLQFNRVLFANVEAYVSPGSINPANIIVDPTVTVPVSSDPRLIIPKINIDVPVNYNAKPDQASQLKAMENGVAWFGIPGANSRPGQAGNTVLSGHSSNDLFDAGDYKFIFARLDQLTTGDTFYLNYEGTRYTYTVTKKEVVRPTDVQKLVYDTNNKPVVTLITCTPVGTAQSRLLVTAEQVSPDPTSAKEAPTTSGSGTGQAAMPGNSPTLLNRLFGG